MTEQWLQTDQNRALMAISARRSIKGIGVGAIIWGAINVVLGVIWMQQTAINIVVLLLGLTMMALGIYALSKPNLTVLLLDAIVSVLLLAWNLYITIVNYSVSEDFNPRGLIFPLVVAIMFIQQYFRLLPLRSVIASISTDAIERANALAKSINKSKLKESPDILAASGTFGQWRIQLLPDQAFFVTVNGAHLFVVPKDAFGDAIANTDAAKYKLAIKHPLSVIKVSLNKPNTQTLRTWLESPAAEAPSHEPDAAPPVEEDSASEDMTEQASPS